MRRWFRLWYRLRSMGPAEVLHRVRERLWLLVFRWEHHRFGRDSPGPQAALAFRFCSASEPQLPVLPWAALSAAEEQSLLDAEWPALGFAWTWRDDPDLWRRAPDTGRLWPARFFAAIPFREGNACGDVRVAWEPARLQQLVALALLASTTPSPERARAAVALIERQLRSWGEANPPWSGIHYLSAMECGLRIVAVCHAMDMVRDRLADRAGTWSRLAALVDSHATLILRRLSLHSSAGNHTIAEAAGLVYAGALFRELDGSRSWLSEGLAILDVEAARQVLPDGGGIEQAFWYHLFVVDLLGLVVRLLESRGLEVPVPVSEAWHRGRSFLATFATTPDELPRIGDADGGFALAPQLRLSWQGAVPPTDPLIVRTFPDTGCSVIVDADAGPFRVIFDHGPLGMAPLYGHGHADALQVLVSVGGWDVLCDPGTFTYTGDPRWRRYFRGTRAHNTVAVDGRDQASQRSAFLWVDGYTAEPVVAEVGGDRDIRLLARHDGYRRLGVVHWRGLVYDRTGLLIVWDRLVGDGIQDLELNWHCDGEVAGSGSSWTVSRGATIHLAGSGGMIASHVGDAEPIRGWRAPRYGQRRPIATLTCAARVPLPHEFLTVIRLDALPPDDAKVAAAIEVLRRLAA